MGGPILSVPGCGGHQRRGDSRRHLLVATLFATLLAVALVGAAGTAAGVPGADQPQVENGTGDADANRTASSGENLTTEAGRPRLEGTIELGRTVVDRRLAAALLAAQLEGAETADSRAAVVASTQADVVAEAAALTARHERLAAARARGDLDRGAYLAQLAPLATRARGVRERGQRLLDEADRLSAARRDRHGVNVSAIQASLDEAAAVLAGPDADAAAASLGLPGEQPAAQSPTDEVFADLSGVAPRYNSRVGAVDFGALGWQFQNARATLTVRAPDGDGRVAFGLDGEGRIHGVRPGPHADPTLRLSTNRTTFEAVRSADDPARAFKRELEDGDIRAEGVGLVDGVLWDLADFIGRLD